MPTRPAVAGLLKHQLYLRDPFDGHEQGIVQTFWTWKNEDPIPGARVTSEQAALKSWAQSASWRTLMNASVWATWIKTWDMGATPPARYTPHRIWPVLAGQAGTIWSYQLSWVVALRTQPLGSEERNRQNGRVFHPFPQVGLLSNGVFSTGDATTMTALYNGLRDALKPAAQADRGTWVVPCWTEGGAPRPGGPLLPPVDHCIARRFPGVRRSRQQNIGPYALGT